MKNNAICCAECGQGIKLSKINAAKLGRNTQIVIIGPDCYHTDCYMKKMVRWGYHLKMIHKAYQMGI